MTFTSFKCAFCGKDAEQPTGAVNRARRLGRPLYCNHKCAVGPRKTTLEEKKARKAEYDRELRADPYFREKIREQKVEYFKRTYDPEKAREERKKTMPRHVEYCRRPEYREYKNGYDKKRTEKPFGEWGEAYRVLLELERTICELMPVRYERQKAVGYFSREMIEERKRRRNEQAAQSGRQV